MSDLSYLYGATTGEIGRKAWWLGAIGLMIVSLIVNIMLGVVAGFTGLSASSFGVGLFSLVSLAILFWPYYALTLKRLNDRGRPHLLFWIFITPALLSAVLKLLGVSGKMGVVEIFGQSAPTFEPNMIGKAVGAAAGIIGLWALVELGILRGDRPGQNAAPAPLASGDEEH